MAEVKVENYAIDAAVEMQARLILMAELFRVKNALAPLVSIADGTCPFRVDLQDMTLRSGAEAVAHCEGVIHEYGGGGEHEGDGIKRMKAEYRKEAAAGYAVTYPDLQCVDASGRRLTWEEWEPIQKRIHAGEENADG